MPRTMPNITMPNIVFASCDALPALSESDAILAAALEARGARVAPASWTGPQDAFEGADLIVVRATWDYATRHRAFRDWLEGLEGLGAAVVNAPGLMRWNMDKRYLLELAEKGAPLPPTRAVRPQASSIAEAMAAHRQCRCGACRAFPARSLIIRYAESIGPAEVSRQAPAGQRNQGGQGG